MDTATLDGMNYIGEFEGEIVEGRDSFRSCECPDMEYEAPVFHHEGFGKIRRKVGFPDGRKFLFRFETKDIRRKRDLKSSVRDLIGGEFSYVDLETIIGRETFLYCVYQHLKKTDKGNTTPQFLNCHSIPPMDIANVCGQFNEIFQY